MEEAVKNQFSAKALEDFRLIDAAVGGNEQAYTKLLSLYRPSVYHMILRMVQNTDDAEDLTIESFAKVFRKLHLFKKDFMFSTWLFRVASNNTIDFLRKRRLNTFSIDSSYPGEDGKGASMEVEDSNPTPQEEVIKAQQSKLIRSLIDTLPPQYQELLHLRYFRELSYEEIGNTLHIPVGTIKARLYRARELMHNIIKNKKYQI